MSVNYSSNALFKTSELMVWTLGKVGIWGLYRAGTRSLTGQITDGQEVTGVHCTGCTVTGGELVCWVVPTGWDRWLP